MVKITILSENNASKGDFLAEWGLSILIENNDINLLFDCGKSFSATYNAQKLGIDLNKIDLIVLSHSHYDHTGGLKNILSRINNDETDIIVHPNIFLDKYNKRLGEKDKFMGFPHSKQQLKNYGGNFILTERPMEIGKDIITSGEIPMVTEFENFSSKVKRLIKSNDEYKSDSILEEQAIFIETELGLIVISGCAHRGIINTLYHAQNVTGCDSIYAVIGGIHLINSSKHRVIKTINAFKKFNIQNLGLGHCTGFNALCSIKKEFKKEFFNINVGTIKKNI